MKRALWFSVICALSACTSTSSSGGGGSSSGDEAVEFEDEAAARAAPAASEEVTRAEGLLARGEAAEARALLEAAAQADPRDVRARLDLGLACEMLEDFEGAEAAYREAIAIDENFSEALNNLGALLRDQERGDEAIALLRRAIASRPGFASAHLNLALALEDAEDDAGAEAEYRRVMELAPRDPASRSAVAMLLLRRGDRDHALIELRRALPLAAGSRADLAQIGNGLRRAGDPELAVRALRDAIEAGEEAAPPGLRAELAVALYAAGQRPEAEAALRSLISEAPEYASAHYVLANMLAAREDWAAAATEYQAFLRLAPSAPEAEEARGRLAHVRARGR